MREYQAGTWTDDATTRISHWSADGARSIQVYGFSDGPNEAEQEKAVMERLRTVLAAILGAMEPERAPYTPDEVLLVVDRIPAEQASGESTEWPVHLAPLPVIEIDQPVVTERVKGDQALLSYLSDRQRVLFRHGDGFYEVRVAPVIPIH